MKPQFHIFPLSYRPLEVFPLRFKIPVYTVAIYTCPAWLIRLRQHNRHIWLQNPSNKVVAQKHPEAPRTAEEVVVEVVVNNNIKMEVAPKLKSRVGE